MSVPLDEIYRYGLVTRLPMTETTRAITGLLGTPAERDAQLHRFAGEIRPLFGAGKAGGIKPCDDIDFPCWPSWRWRC